jgi:hypothetical protein
MDEIRAAYNAGHRACVERESIQWNPYRGADALERAWRNGWKDCSTNSCTRGMDPSREYVETSTGAKIG